MILWYNKIVCIKKVFLFMAQEQNIKEEKSQVFVIEDDVLLNRAYNAKFEHENIKAVFATDGDEAL